MVSMDSFFKALGVNSGEDMDDEDYETGRPAGRDEDGKVIDLSKKKKAIRGNGDPAVCIARPTSFEECSRIVSLLISGQIVLVDMKGVDYQVRQRIMDVIAGTLYVLGGGEKIISEQVYLYTPGNTEVIDVEELEEE